MVEVMMDRTVEVPEERTVPHLRPVERTIEVPVERTVSVPVVGEPAVECQL